MTVTRKAGEIPIQTARLQESEAQRDPPADFLGGGAAEHESRVGGTEPCGCQGDKGLETRRARSVGLEIQGQYRWTLQLPGKGLQHSLPLRFVQ